MEPNGHRRNHTVPDPIPIPLQDLSRPPETPDRGDTPTSHRRTLSERVRSGVTRSGGGFQASYTPLGGSPIRDRLHGATLRPVTPSPRYGRGAHSIDEDDDDEHSPLTDRGRFSEAMAFATFGVDNSAISTTPGASILPGGHVGMDNLLGETDSLSDFPEMEYEDGEHEGPAHDDDRAPLTDNKFLRPASSLTPSSASAKKSDRSRGRSVRFSTSGTTPSSRLGDDLGAAEAGLSPNGRSRRSTSRSLSPAAASSPLHRASTVMRKMSQRIVNLSNEPESVQHDVRRSISESASRKSSFNASMDPDDEQDETVQPDTSYDGSRSVMESTESPTKRRTRGLSVVEDKDWKQRANPLRGYSLGIVPPDNWMRTFLCDLLVHPVTEAVILILIVVQTVLLAIQAAPNYFDQVDEHGLELGGWGGSWFDYALLGLFGIYTIEVGIRIVVSGFILNPVEYSTINRSIGWKTAMRAWWRSLFTLHDDKIAAHQNGATQPAQPMPGSILRTFTQQKIDPTFRGGARQQRRVRLGHRAFLRHSFNRLDFVAVISFWISFAFAISGLQNSKHVYAFRMLSSLRILRLLGLTNGTHIILRSLKKAAPLLLNVALLIGFFWLLFGIVGVQAFRSSLRRTCVWTNSSQIDWMYDDSADWGYNQTGNYQFCGGSLNVTAGGMERLPWFKEDGTTLGISKGYLCPPNSFCIETTNPYNGTVSFDNIFQSLELVFVIMTGNTYSDLMYYLADSDHLIAVLFFAIGVVIFLFWLVNLLIAVITTSFQVIREENASSAFSNKHDDSLDLEEKPEPVRKGSLLYMYNKSFWIWIAVIIYGIICQAMRTANMSRSREHFVDISETIVTVILFVEIVLRFIVDWRHFFRKRRNWFDLFLAVITLVIQFPGIHNNGAAYRWMTMFQIMRLYRVVMAVKLTRELILLVLGNATGLANLFLFVFLLTFLVSIFASQLFRGQIPEYDSYGNVQEITFATIWNSFIGVYQVLSSENWTSLLYAVTTFDNASNTAWIGAIFFIIWFILAFFVVLNMFIAVIQENFDVSEDKKRVQQVRAYLQSRELGVPTASKLSLSAVFRLRGWRRQQDPLDYGNAMMDQLLKGSVVDDFIGEGAEQLNSPPNGHVNGEPKGHANSTNGHIGPQARLVHAGPSGVLRTIRDRFWGEQGLNPFYSRMKFSGDANEIDPRKLAKEAAWAKDQMKLSQRQYLQQHPQYNKSLFIFGPKNLIRRSCQRIVEPGRGAERIEGAAPSKPVWYFFSTFLYLSIVAMVLLACITTPVYQKEYFAANNDDYFVKNWFTYTDLGFASLFTLEAVIRVIADGLFFTPHAYYRTSWGIIDAIVLITLWINVSTALYNIGEVSRAVGAFKALRALRLLNISDNAKNTFHSVIVRGGWKILSAAFVSLSLLVPFAIFGLNLFNGRLETCNVQNAVMTDPQYKYLNNCVNEWSSSPFGWNVIAPTQVKNPYYSFDDFGNALFILFQIVSQEGWVDVMWSAMAITGPTLQPQYNASQGNAVFFIVFNLLGSVFVLTLFISVFMRNYTEQTGVAFLTTEQRSWLELRKRLKQVSPSKRPTAWIARSAWREMCYKLASRKTGQWPRFVTAVLVGHLILLCLEFYPAPKWWDTTRTFMFLGLTLFYLVNIGIRITGLTWTRFRRSSWDMYSLVSVSATFAVTIVYISYPQSLQNTELYTFWQQMHKLLLVSIVLLLIPRNNQLDQLFKTAAASLPAVINLLATWFVLFLVFAIALTQTFGLTRFGNNETGNVNFRSVPKALIFLFRMSTGEGWNQLMEDYAQITEPFCNSSDNFLENDCGSASWARALFIAWNILSMYIFVNMFISLIFESFSYVYQRSSGLQAVSREEIRRFKHAWSEVDPEGTGYIPVEKFQRLLGELSGVFEMRIYPPEYSVTNLVQECKVSVRDSNPFADSERVQRIDLAKLNERLRSMPISQVRDRRRTLEVFYQEILLSAKRTDRGIGFTDLLMTLAHYKIINDSQSLRLEEFLRRRARLGIVEDEVRRKIVTNFISTIHRRAVFLRNRESRRMTMPPQLQVPEIFVEDEDDSDRASMSGSLRANRPALSLTIPPPGHDTAFRASGTDARDTPTSPGLRNRAESFSPRDSPTRPSVDTRPSFTSQRSWEKSPQLSPYRPSTSQPPSPLDFAADMQSGDGMLGAAGRATSVGLGLQVRRSLSPTASAAMAGRLSAETTPGRTARERRSTGAARDVLDVMEESPWGEALRRSMTGTGTRPRRGTRASSGAGSGGSREAGHGGGGGGGASGRDASEERS